MQRASLLIGSLAVLALVMVTTRPGPAQEPTATEPPSTTRAGAIAGLETFEVDSARHTERTVDYPQDPPAGGRHHPVWQDCGFYEAPVRNEHAVHSQEHGAVWITYRPDLPARDVGILRRLAERTPYLLVSPYPGLTDPLVASAWGAQLRLDGADDRRLRLFIRAYAGEGPERGASCSGGIAETIPLGTPVASPAPEAVPAGTPAPATD